MNLSIPPITIAITIIIIMMILLFLIIMFVNKNRKINGSSYRLLYDLAFSDDKILGDTVETTPELETTMNKFDESYAESSIITVNNGLITNPHPIELIDTLPVSLANHLYDELKIDSPNDLTKQDIERVKKAIEKYFRKTNLINSIRLAISSSSTLGKKETVKHAVQKFQKHLKK